MVKTIIDGMNVQQYMTSYSIENPAIYGSNNFVDVNTGTEIQDKVGDKVILKMTFHMPTPEALKLASSMQKESFFVEYTTPVPAACYFKKTEYSAECEDADPEETDFKITDGIMWDISATIESVDYTASGGYL